MLWSMGSWRVRHDLVIEQEQPSALRLFLSCPLEVSRLALSTTQWTIWSLHFSHLASVHSHLSLEVLSALVSIGSLARLGVPHSRCAAPDLLNPGFWS